MSAVNLDQFDSFLLTKSINFCQKQPNLTASNSPMDIDTLFLWRTTQKKKNPKNNHKYDASQKATTMGAMTFRLTFKGRKMAHLMADLPTQHLFEKAEHCFSIVQKSIHVSRHKNRRRKKGVQQSLILKKMKTYQCDMKTDCNSYDRVYFPPFTT